MAFDEGLGARLLGLPGALRVGFDLPRLEEHLPDLLLVAEHDLPEGGADLGLLGRFPPQRVLQEQDALVRDLRVARQVRVGLQERQGLAVAPVRGHDLLLAEPPADLAQGPAHVAGDLLPVRGLLQAGELFEGDADPGLRPRRFQHAQEPEVLLDVAHGEPEQEPVVQGRELVVLGELVAGPEQGDERHLVDALAVVEPALVDDGQDRVEDRGVGLEHLVQEGDVGLRELVGGHPPVVVLLQPLQAHRAEQLFGRGEAGQQPLEVPGAFDAAAQLVREHRLGRPRRSDDQQVPGREQGRQGAVDEFASFQERLPQLVAKRQQFFPGSHAGRPSEAFPRRSSKSRAARQRARRGERKLGTIARSS